MLPAILDKTSVFMKHSDSFVSNSQSFSLVRLAVNLTFDVISSVAMDCDFGAQSDELGEFMRAYRELLESYTKEQMDLPWFLTPRMEWRRYQLAKRLRLTLRQVVYQAFSQRDDRTTKSRSILSLSLQGIDHLTPQVVDEVCDQLNTFLFAGHDTTGVLLSWMFYELSRTPHALKAVRDELDGIFGPGEQNASFWTS